MKRWNVIWNKVQNFWSVSFHHHCQRKRSQKFPAGFVKGQCWWFTHLQLRKIWFKVHLETWFMSDQKLHLESIYLQGDIGGKRLCCSGIIWSTREEGDKKKAHFLHIWEEGDICRGAKYAYKILEHHFGGCFVVAWWHFSTNLVAFFK